MSNTFCVSITHCREDGDKATVGFVVANAAIGSEKSTMVFLSTDGVWCAVKGEAEKISVGAPVCAVEGASRQIREGGWPDIGVHALHEEARHYRGSTH